MTTDKCCSIAPYFKIHKGKNEEFRTLCEAFINRTKNEPKCLYYGFSFDEDHVHCREAYEDAEGLLNHLTNVGDLLQKSGTLADLIRVEVHGSASELEQLKEPLEGLTPQYFTLEYGFRKG